MSLLSDRKNMFRDIANENLTGTELSDCLFAIDDAVWSPDMKTIKETYLTFPEKDLAKMKANINTYSWYLMNRGIRGSELEKIKARLLNTTTQDEFVAIYKW